MAVGTTTVSPVVCVRNPPNMKINHVLPQLLFSGNLNLKLWHPVKNVFEAEALEFTNYMLYQHLEQKNYVKQFNGRIPH